MTQYVKRSEWDTVAPTNATAWNPDRLLGGGIHWFGIPDGPNDHSRCDDILRGVRASHSNGEFNDIAYNHAVCQHGFIYELRGFGYQTGANGYAEVNRQFYSIVCILGKNDPPGEFTPAMQAALRDAIGMWQGRGAGRVVTYHGYWTGSECPGAVVRTWIKAGLWKQQEDEKVDNSVLLWLDDWLRWRLVQNADPAKRPANVPEDIPQAAWDIAKMCQAISTYLGMSEGEEQWIKWRLTGGARPQVPTAIPDPWWDDAKRVHQIATDYAEKV